jgi:hypothetical protein
MRGRDDCHFLHPCAVGHTLPLCPQEVPPSHAGAAVISALVTALCIGYHVGRRAGSTPPIWRKRTSRVALSELAVSLLVLMTVRRIRQSFLAERVFPDARGVRGMTFVEPLQLLQRSFAHLRLY